MLPYEQSILKRLRQWQDQPPGWGTRLLARPGNAVSELVQDLVPVTALRAALEGGDRLARKLSDERSILARAGAAHVDELRAFSLEDCDRLARSVGQRASALGGATGALFGVAGAAGLAADVPVLLTLALRTIHRVGLCYGDKPDGVVEQSLGIGVFALVSANSMEEKQAALRALRTPDGAPVDAAWRDGIERVTERELAKNATVYSLHNLARSIGINLGRRKAAGSIPVLGAAVGGAVNAWYLADVAQTARYVFQERWLRGKYPQFALDRAPAG